MLKSISNTIIILTIWGLIFPGFSFGEIIDPPKTLEEIKTAGWNALKIFPEFLKKIWQEFLDFLQGVWHWLKNIWDTYIYPFFYNLWQKTLGKEIKERTPIIKEELKEKKEEITKEIKDGLSKIQKSIWEKFKGLIK